ncbi:hypothetical protein LBMAG16_13510 [Actinomycetes bacterium]|nr:hypothetical protein LBMAG16_13510 [Actinomycetes bacterium]
MMQNSEQNNEEIIAQLRNISETLADRALSALKEAHAAGEAKRPEIERTLTQARRAIEKAIGLLVR